MTARAGAGWVSGHTGSVLAVAGWVALIVGTRLWGVRVAAASPDEMALGAMPLFGTWDLRLGIAAGVAAAAGVAGVVALPWLARRLSWRAVVVVAGVAAAAWALALGVVDGERVLGESIYRDYGEHTGLVDAAGGALAYLRGYVERQGGYPVHLQAHPPGLSLLLWLTQGAGLDKTWWYIGLPVAATAAAAMAAVAAFGEVAGRSVARRVAPFVALAPAAVWRVNADALFAGPVLVGIALVVVATGRRGRPAVALAVAGGATFGAALLLTYGAAAMFVPIVAVASWRRRFDVLALAGAATAAVLVAPLAAGFWWLDGLAATRRQYAASIASVRPYSYFVVANIGVAALATGPAVAAGLVRLRSRGAWVLVGAGLVALVAVDVSGLSKAEVERIWQPFYPLLLLGAAGVAGACATDGSGGERGWLAAQVAVAVALQCSLRSPW